MICTLVSPSIKGASSKYLPPRAVARTRGMRQVYIRSCTALGLLLRLFPVITPTIGVGEAQGPGNRSMASAFYSRAAQTHKSAVTFSLFLCPVVIQSLRLCSLRKDEMVREGRHFPRTPCIWLHRVPPLLSRTAFEDGAVMTLLSSQLQ